MLCQALPKQILENISTLTNSAEEIWNYLDEKYGRSEVVAREIMTELMSLDPKRLGSRFMGRFCTTLLDTHSLLQSINEEDWLVSNRTVAELEGKLPREEKLEWARQYNTLPGITKFERFKEFMQQRKTVMEVMETLGEVPRDTGGGTSKCGFCGKAGHDESRCFAKQREQGLSRKFKGAVLSVTAWSIGRMSVLRGRHTRTRSSLVTREVSPILPRGKLRGEQEMVRKGVVEEHMVGILAVTL